MIDDAAAAASRFVWHELITQDVEKSRDFYAKLLGWTYAEQDMGTWKYTMIQVGDQAVGGMMVPQDAPDVPSHWLGYILTGDVDAAVKKTTALGGQVYKPATEIPGVGRFSVISDASGAVLAPFSAPGGMPEPPDPLPDGHFCWDELLTTDTEGCGKFYQDVFGWTREGFDIPGMGTYHIFKRGDKQAGGMMQMPPGPGAPPCWLHYIQVADVDASAAKLNELGGEVHVEPTDIPEVGRFAVTSDTVGAAIALFKGGS